MTLHRRPRGLTLAELCVMTVIFSLFSTTVLATLSMALRYWTQSNQRILAQQNARVAIGVITNELRQAIPSQSAAVGYQKISPAVDPTGVTMPNANSTTSSTLTFTEPTSGYDPDNPSMATNYQLIEYYVESNSLKRRARQYNSSGVEITSAQTVDVLVSGSTSGLLQIQVTYSEPTLFTVQITSREGASVNVLSAKVRTLGL